MTQKQAERLVREFWGRVDNGSCPYCTRQAVDACAAVISGVDWDTAYRKVVDEDES